MIPDVIRIGKWIFRANVFRLECGKENIKLEPRVARLLSYLAANAGMPVNRETLMEEVWPGMVVGDEALTNAINKLRKAFKDDRRKPKVIETIPKAGYRLIATVEKISTPARAAEKTAILSNAPSVSKLWLQHKTPIIFMVILLITYPLWMPFVPDTTNEPTSDQIVLSVKPSIAVLPFDNLSQDSKQEYFTDGVTDDIITRLAKSSDLVVIARDSSFFYKNTDIDIKDVAGKLNVKYVLHGSIRRMGERLVINAQLINAANGSHTWAEQYLDVANNLFRIENEIAQKVIAALLNKKENNYALRPMSTQTKHVQAHDYLLLGRYHFYKFASKIENTKAQNLFREAIELDPEYALAYALLGWTYNFEAMNGWADDRPAALRKAEQLANKAIVLQPGLPLSYYVRGLSYRERGEYVEALAEIETALRYDPSNANAKVLLATLLYYAGRPEIGLERIKEAMKINPHHPYNYHFHLGQAYFVLRRYQEAQDAFEQGLESNPGAERLHVWMAASYAQAGDIENANWEADQVLTINPNFSVTRMEKAFPFKDPAELKHFTDGLRLAGLN